MQATDNKSYSLQHECFNAESQVKYCVEAKSCVRGFKRKERGFNTRFEYCANVTLFMMVKVFSRNGL